MTWGPWTLQEVAVIFRQLFDATSGTYTYLLASRRGGEALIIDPVLERVDRYLQLIRELDLKLVKAIDPPHPGHGGAVQRRCGIDADRRWRPARHRRHQPRCRLHARPYRRFLQLHH